MSSNLKCGPVQICDFNLSDILGADGCITSGEPISPPWSAPERLSGLPFGTPADVFSFGVVLWELISLGAALFSLLGHVFGKIRQMHCKCMEISGRLHGLQSMFGIQSAADHAYNPRMHLQLGAVCLSVTETH